MKFFRKSDEMERNIVSKSEKIALTFAKLCLMAWCIYIIVTEGVQKLISSWPFLLVLTTTLVQTWSARIIKWKINRGNKDEK
jgi:hypothetical protein